jgi:hypothetical protein
LKQQSIGERSIAAQRADSSIAPNQESKLKRFVSVNGASKNLPRGIHGQGGFVQVNVALSLEQGKQNPAQPQKNW